MRDEFIYSPRVDIVEWIRERIPAAIEFARRDIEATARARAHHLARYRETGRCPLGHHWPTSPTPCGYCENTRQSALHPEVPA